MTERIFVNSSYYSVRNDAFKYIFRAQSPLIPLCRACRYLLQLVLKLEHDCTCQYDNEMKILRFMKLKPVVMGYLSYTLFRVMNESMKVGSVTLSIINNIFALMVTML
jgi:hypothetical protein